ncbi:MAG: S41 family peptidase [Gemmataceae bacterium]|nr:S41 family peptidase [Gemmataceae bacterium]MCI0739946.1 S41 family peptidase [Gemmataceae bacterium]
MSKRFLVGLLALFAGWIQSAKADDLPTQAYVVLVGIDKYEDPQIKPRLHAEADAKALYDLFTSKEHLGIDAKGIKLLLGAADEKRGSQPATKENILKALTWAQKSARRDDLVVFSFFGNGAPLGERACYFATDSTFKERAKTAVASGDIEHILDDLQSQRFVAFVDCNFLGFDAGKEGPDPNLANFYREYLGNEDAKIAAPSRVVFLANQGLKPSLNLGEHGIFAQVLIDGLAGKADKEGYEADGNITIGELVKFVRKEQPRLARENGKSDDEKGQLPVILEGQSSDFIIERNPAAFPKARARLAKFEKLGEELKLEKNIVEEGVNLLTRMPKLEARQALRKTYQKLADGEFDSKAFAAARDNILDTTKISTEDAGKYALMVLRAAKVVRQGFVEDVKQTALVDYAVRGMYKQIDEKMPSAIKEKLDNIKSMKDMDLLKLLSEARQHLGKREDLANGKDITHSLHAMLGKLDKHTDYIDPETLTRLRQDIEGDFTGIGVQIRKNNTKDALQVVTPLRGSPAYKSKIYAGDLITSIIREVDSEGNKLPEVEVLSTKGMTTEEAVKKILGKEGTPVKLMIEREGEAKPLEFNLIRGRVELESVVGVHRNEDDSWNYVVDPENKICYVRLSSFSKNTHRDLEVVMRKLSKAGIKGFILDLRFNPGGLLDSAVKITDLFIDDGLIVTIRPRNGAETSYIGKSDGRFSAFPMVCLVNGGSASASEIVSAALQDHGRAIVVGTRSYGKGSVQTIHPFDTGGRLKLTTATFWRPSGRNLNRIASSKEEDDWGVIPNEGYTLKLNAKELNDLQEFQREHEIIHGPGHRKSESINAFRDRQMEMALDYLRAMIKTARTNGAKKAG